MEMISHRECHLIGLQNEALNNFVDEIKNYLKEGDIPDNYTINVYKDTVACCGIYPIGVSVEIRGPEKQPIDNLDLKVYSKIIEICERDGVEYHECSPIEVINIEE